MRIYNSEDWFYKLGIVGFNKILHYNSEFHGLDLDYYNYSVNEDYIEFDVEILKDFPTYYYNYFIYKYDVSKSLNQKLEWQLLGITNKDNFKERFKDIKKIISDRNKKIEKLGVSEYTECKEIESAISKLTYDQIDELEELLERYKELVAIDYINHPMSVAYFKFIFRKHFFGQISFLNVSKSTCTISEQKNILYDDYLRPIIDAEKFKEIINEDNEELLKEYINYKQNKNKKYDISDNEVDKVLSSFNKDLFGKRRKVKSIATKLKTLNTCRFCDDSISFGNNYTDGNFIPLAISNEKAKNFFWNFNVEFPICPLCKFILFCTPAGCAKIVKKYMDDKFDYNDKLYYGFISIDGSLSELIKQNDYFMDISSKNGVFETYLLDAVNRNHKISEWQLQSILYVEFNIDYDTKSSKLNYFNIPTYLAKFLRNDSRILENIKDPAERMRAFDAILKRSDLKHIIDFKLRTIVNEIRKRENLAGSAFALSIIIKLIYLRNYIKQYKRGCSKVDVSSIKCIDAVYFQGIGIADVYKQKNNENQLTGISYKLLNAAKAGNKKDFMDTIIRIYISVEKEIPMLFLQVMKEEKLDFTEIAYSFITGLNSKIKEN